MEYYTVCYGCGLEIFLSEEEYSSANYFYCSECGQEIRKNELEDVSDL